MIGKPEWFKRRKYTGQGITPKTWQGWIYTISIIIPIIALQIIPFLENFKTIGSGIWVIIVILDCIDIMRKL